MTTETQITLRKTALNAAHRARGARMTNFGGFEMPVEYRSLIEEHLAVRTAAGLFDVSHMGEIEVRGRQTLDLVQYVTSNDASRLAVGQAQYSALLRLDGTFVDDVVVHKISHEHYLFCVNAANREKDYEWIRSHNRFEARVENRSDAYTQLALQGPRAAAILAQLTPRDLAPLRPYRFAFGKVAGVDCLIARTGYTGEDGFELYFDPAHSEMIWNALLEAGKSDGLQPAGLGARNTLRLEAGYALYGHEIDETTTAWEAKLDWICKLDKGDFIGREALRAQKEKGLEHTLVGFEMRERGIGRDGYPVVVAGEECGRVTSGSYAPWLKKNIGLAYVPVGASAVGTRIDIRIRGREVAAEIVPTPFYQRSR
ncbi:MAG: glycine cleavage system aminomethyltransferase GcvT [Terriglobia bacterium]